MYQLRALSIAYHLLSLKYVGVLIGQLKSKIIKVMNGFRMGLSVLHRGVIGAEAEAELVIEDIIADHAALHAVDHLGVIEGFGTSSFT